MDIQEAHLVQRLTALRLLQHFTEHLERTSSRTSISSEHYLRFRCRGPSGLLRHSSQCAWPRVSVGGPYSESKPSVRRSTLPPSRVESGLENISASAVCRCARDLGGAATDACYTRVLLVWQTDGTRYACLHVGHLSSEDRWQ